jgi:predicted regulator of Ras-like GTPase activity (Roadblock/LC7/MglB family)
MALLHLTTEILERVERRILELLNETEASAVLLIDRSGLVIAWAGDPPLHPNQIGAVAAGIFSAMRAMIKAGRTEEFSIRMPESGSNFYFQHVEGGSFLCAIINGDAKDENLRKGLKNLASEARESFSQGQPPSSDPESLQFIEEKLNELFRN